jgi:hypothetical protein
MSEEAELASPAAAIVARRESRMPERLKVSAPDDSPDDDWDPEEGAGATDEEDSDAEDSAGADGTDFIRIATPLRAAGGCGRLGVHTDAACTKIARSIQGGAARRIVFHNDTRITRYSHIRLIQITQQ